MANMIPLLTNPTWSSLLRNNAVLAFCYVCVDGNKFYSLCLCNEESFTLDLGKSYLLHPTCLYLPEFDQRTQLTNERFDPTIHPFNPRGFLHCSLLSSPCELRFITGLRIYS
ncbi:hypothetical protein T4E_2984 [Trichinella pseudospiralis]|uniref:Uncharacterized protein n=1 Tax=Trichinella pseudospiralis TaxID=6337 RepID=A0A0V0YH73_TRIPS|nr:hypothetical protein T4E_2984 [Trichinella pseudospiralis]